MFAVPGWSVSAGSLKAEAVTGSQHSAPKAAKKRKRGNAQQQQQLEDVDPSSVGDLWASVVEGAGDASTKKRQKKREASDGDKVESKIAEPAAESSVPSQEVEEDIKAEKDKKKDKKDKKERKKEKKEKKAGKDDAADTESTGVDKTTSMSAPPAAPAPVLPTPPKLTPLQASMRQKLISARFRHLNETLYTRPSEEAFDLFKESPEMFDEYHEGFRQQVKVWPENPVSSFLKDVRARGKARTPGKGKPNAPAAPLSRTPLPRTSGTCTIADLGCGDAQLSQSLDADKGKLRLQVRSFDLQAPNKHITQADISNLPLADGSVDVAVFCLALMGTNWVDFIEEAYRVLRWKGELWVAEIKSRFGPARSNKKAPVRHSVGARSKKGAPGKKGEDPAQHEGDLAVEVDGADDRRRETDVSAFVEVLRKRGFVLQGEKGEAVDLSNKMFVKMHFVKGAPPTKGTGVSASNAPKIGGRGGDKMRTFEEHAKNAENDDDVDEASILKPCVYKIR